MGEKELNPQPLPPRVDLADLTAAVTASVRRALEERKVTADTPPAFRDPRIIVGLILEPTAVRGPVRE